MKSILFTFLSAVLLSSCTTEIATYTMASTQPIDMTSLSKYSFAEMRTVTGSHSGQEQMPHGLLPDYAIQDAMNKAIQTGGSSCVGLSSVSITSKRNLWGQVTVTVTGRPILRK